MLSFMPLCAAAAAIQAQCFETAWGGSAMATVLAMPGVFGWLALIDPALGYRAGELHHQSVGVGVPVGLVLCRRILDEAEILTIGVVPEARRLGFGRRLLESVLAAGGGRAMFLEVAVDNTAAIALYRVLGFKQVGRRLGYYQRAGMAVDALVMHFPPRD